MGAPFRGLFVLATAVDGMASRRGGALLLLVGVLGRVCVSGLSASSKALKAHTAFVNRATGGGGAASPASGAAAHAARQREVFDEASSFFASPEASPPEVEAVLDDIAARVVAAGPRRVLDVGCGTGCLSRRYGAFAAGGDGVEVVGVDLSPKMLEYAESRGGANVSYVCADVVDYAADSDGETPFDAVVFNACFGNMFDQGAALAAAARRLAVGGVVSVTHPLGAAFVDDLKARDATVVPHSLPRTEDAAAALLGPESFLDLASLDLGPPYVATFQKRPFARLARPVGLRGPVARGYGRGGKKLGVPTANLPEGLFGDVLTQVPAGVYGAWAQLGTETAAPRPAVVNVGYSPTFEGAENAAKIAEAHLLDYDGADFYDEPLAIVLVSFQRPEMKFPDFPTLLANIRNDIDVATAALASDADLSALRPKVAAFLSGGAAVASEYFE